MMHLVETSEDGSALRICAEGELTHEDYKVMIPMLDDAIVKHGRISVMADLTKLEHVQARAVLDDFAFDIRHINDFTRIAVVGNKDWHDWMTRASAHLTPAEMRYFDATETEAAWSWTCGAEV